jgi:ABC-type sugar transport system ATPase subunit
MTRPRPLLRFDVHPPEGALIMIEAQGLTKQYGETIAVDNLSFTVQPGS